ncbi:MAG: NUDIX domain-containing protein [Ornithinimicrobium sp.]
MRSGPSPQVVVAAAAVVDDLARPSQLLAGRRSAPADLAGRWELPGGKVEPGEQARDAVCRELREELGVGARLGSQVWGPSTDHPGAWPLGPGLVMTLYWARIAAGHPRPLADHDALRWLTRAELDSVPWLESNTAITAYLRGRMHE